MTRGVGHSTGNFCAEEDSPFARLGYGLVAAGKAAEASAHPLIANVWVTRNSYAKQVVIEIWFRRRVTSEEAQEVARAAREVMRPWFENEGIDESWHVSARRGRKRHPNAFWQLVPLLTDDARITKVRTRWPREPEYRDARPPGLKKAQVADAEPKRLRRAGG